LSNFPEGRLRSLQLSRAQRAASMSQPWISRFDPPELAAMLRELGFDELEDLGPAQIGRRFLGVERREGPGGHLMRARMSVSSNISNT
jgi:hypothetical protein